MALKPAQPKVEAKKIEPKKLDAKPNLEAKPVDAKPVDAKPIEGKPVVDVKPGEVAGGSAPAIGDAPTVEGEQKKKADWNTFSSVAMSKIPVSAPVRGSVLSARIEVLKKPKPAPVAEDSDE